MIFLLTLLQYFLAKVINNPLTNPYIFLGRIQMNYQKNQQSYMLETQSAWDILRFNFTFWYYLENLHLAQRNIHSLLFYRL